MENKLILKGIWRLTCPQLKNVLDRVCEYLEVKLDIQFAKSSISR